MTIIAGKIQNIKFNSFIYLHFIIIIFKDNRRPDLPESTSRAIFTPRKPRKRPSPGSDRGSAVQDDFSTCWIEVGEDHGSFGAVAGFVAAAGSCGFSLWRLLGGRVGGFLHLPDIEQRFGHHRTRRIEMCFISLFIKSC